MISKIFSVSVVYACLGVAGTCFLASPCCGDDVTKKHVAFARSLLDSPDELTRARALEVVLASAPSDGLQLARKALQDRAEMVRSSAFAYQPGRADKEFLRAARELLAKNARRGNVERGVINSTDITAECAAEALLESNDQEGRKQAIAWIEALLGDPSDRGVWEMATALVGKYRLSQLKGHLTGSKIQGDERGIAAAGLAKLGDEPSQKQLRDKLTDPRWYFFVVNDLELVKLLGLSRKQIESAVPSRAELERQFHDSKENDGIIESSLGQNETAMARACACLGHPEHLRRLAQQMLDLSKSPGESSKRDKLFSILGAIKDVGDESMIPVLEDFFANVRTREFYCPMHPEIFRFTLERNGDVSQCPICGMPLAVRDKGKANDWNKLDASLAIVKIAARRDGRNPVSK